MIEVSALTDEVGTLRVTQQLVRAARAARQAMGNV
jgi:hypothetical protein